MHFSRTNCMLIESVEFIDYQREGSGVVVASGCGIGMAVMDAVTECRYFCDIDKYRRAQIDWELIAVLLSLRIQPSVILLVGWFTIDEPRHFNAFERGCVTVKALRYDGGHCETLHDFLARARAAVSEPNKSC